MRDDKGVLVMLNEQIMAARHATKTDTTATNAFRSSEQGNLGQIAGGTVHFFNAPTRLHTVATEFSLAGIDELPQVDILYDHQGAGMHLYRAAIEAGADRLELCAGLEVGGLTPSIGLVETVVAMSTVPVIAMLRPRAGGLLRRSMVAISGSCAPPKRLGSLSSV